MAFSPTAPLQLSTPVSQNRRDRARHGRTDNNDNVSSLLPSLLAWEGETGDQLMENMQQQIKKKKKKEPQLAVSTRELVRLLTGVLEEEDPESANIALDFCSSHFKFHTFQDVKPENVAGTFERLHEKFVMAGLVRCADVFSKSYRTVSTAIETGNEKVKEALPAVLMLLVELANAPTRTRKEEARLVQLDSTRGDAKQDGDNTNTNGRVSAEADALREFNATASLLEDDIWAQEMRYESGKSETSDTDRSEDWSTDDEEHPNHEADSNAQLEQQQTHSTPFSNVTPVPFVSFSMPASKGSSDNQTQESIAHTSALAISTSRRAPNVRNPTCVLGVALDLQAASRDTISETLIQTSPIMFTHENHVEAETPTHASPAKQHRHDKTGTTGLTSAARLPRVRHEVEVVHAALHALVGFKSELFDPKRVSVRPDLDIVSALLHVSPTCLRKWTEYIHNCVSTIDRLRSFACDDTSDLRFDTSSVLPSLTLSLLRVSLRAELEVWDASVCDKEDSLTHSRAGAIHTLLGLERWLRRSNAFADIERLHNCLFEWIDWCSRAAQITRIQTGALLSNLWELARDERTINMAHMSQSKLFVTVNFIDEACATKRRNWSNKGITTKNVMHRTFERTCEAYLRILDQWVQEGQLLDPFEEVFLTFPKHDRVSSDQDYLSSNSDHLDNFGDANIADNTQCTGEQTALAVTMVEQAVPWFLENKKAILILECGSLGALKQTIRHGTITDTFSKGSHYERCATQMRNKDQFKDVRTESNSQMLSKSVFVNTDEEDFLSSSQSSGNDSENDNYACNIHPCFAWSLSPLKRPGQQINTAYNNNNNNNNNFSNSDDDINNSNSNNNNNNAYVMTSLSSGAEQVVFDALLQAERMMSVRTSNSREAWNRSVDFHGMSQQLLSIDDLLNTATTTHARLNAEIVTALVKPPLGFSPSSVVVCLPTFLQGLHALYLFEMGDLLRTFTEAVFEALDKGDYQLTSAVGSFVSPVHNIGYGGQNKAIASPVEQELEGLVCADLPELQQRCGLELEVSVSFKASSARCDIHALDGLHIGVHVPSPLDQVITARVMTDYKRVFLFLLKIKRVRYVLNQLHHDARQLCRHQSEDRELRGALHKLFLFIKEQMHFVNHLHDHILHRTLDMSAHELLRAVTNANDVNELRELQMCALESMCDSCLLPPSTASGNVQQDERTASENEATEQTQSTFGNGSLDAQAKCREAVLALLDSVLQFVQRGKQFVKQSQSHSGYVTQGRRLWKSIVAFHSNFTRAQHFFKLVLRRRVVHGDVPHLEDILLRLDFNKKVKLVDSRAR